jgi:ABC-type sugar transport system ATPase subunit
MTPRLELRQVKKRFGNVEAVRGVDLVLRRGEFVSLLGPSGCGKSTTLAMIAGFEQPSSGEILIDGHSMIGVAAGRRQIGLVFQDYAIFSRLKVRDNLSFGLEAQRVSRPERRRRLAEVTSRLDLEPLLEKPGAALNMSEMQRVAIARVLVTEPRMLLLDEPMSNLDASVRASLRGELKLIQRALGQSVLYVTHDQIEALSMSDRIAVMRDGLIEQIGTPYEIYHRPLTRFVAEFIGEPPINLIPCVVRRDGPQMFTETALHTSPPMRGDVPVGNHLLGVRPHSLQLSQTPLAGAAEVKVRFVENLGADHVLHLQYGDMLAATVVEPNFAISGARVWVSIDWEQACLIRNDNSRIVWPEVA